MGAVLGSVIVLLVIYFGIQKRKTHTQQRQLERGRGVVCPTSLNDKKKNAPQRHQNGNTDGSDYEIPSSNTTNFEMSFTTHTFYGSLQNNEANEVSPAVKKWNASEYNIQEDPYYCEIKVGEDGYINMQL